MEALQDDVFTTVGLTAGVEAEGKVAEGQGGGPMGGRMETEEQETQVSQAESASVSQDGMWQCPKSPKKPRSFFD